MKSKLQAEKLLARERTRMRLMITNDVIQEYFLRGQAVAYKRIRQSKSTPDSAKDQAALYHVLLMLRNDIVSTPSLYPDDK